MCGIAGIIQYHNHPVENIQAMNQAMLHRGPDAGNFYLDEERHIVLGHRRLSIVDLSENGAQPMTSKSGRYILCYNGEIYNHQLLIRKIKREGYPLTLRGTSDTEVLLEAIEIYGLQKTLEFCKGMFALALYDRKLGKLFLTRDRVGEKPLYYGMIKGSFLFSSDLGSMRAVDFFDSKVNGQVLGLYFQHGYIPTPYTIYEGIRKLEAGTLLTLDTASLEYSIQPYYSMSEVAQRGQSNIFVGTEKEAADELERLLKEAVKGQMISDVPLGAFLSGGIDSSLVVTMMQQVATNPVKTFTIGFDVDKFNEAEYAKKIAERLGTKHTELYVNEEDAFDTILNIPKAFTEPFADSSQIPTMMVSKMTREHVTVSLSGDGGDELFCGYNSYTASGPQMQALKKRFSYLPGGMKRAIGKAAGQLSGQKAGALYKLANYFTLDSEETDHARSGLEDGRTLLLSNKRCEGGIRFAGERLLPCSNTLYQPGFLPHSENNLMLMDLLQYHPDDILVKVDRAGMFYSLETRIPLLDRDIIDFAWSLPLEYKYKDGVTKKLMRDVLYRYIPRNMMERPKKGFSVPLAQWLAKGKMRIWAENVMHDGAKAAGEYVNTTLAETLWKEYKQKGKWTEKNWYILMLYQWFLNQ